MVRDVDSGEPTNRVLDRGPDHPYEGGNFEEENGGP